MKTYFLASVEDNMLKTKLRYRIFVRCFKYIIRVFSENYQIKVVLTTSFRCLEGKQQLLGQQKLCLQNNEKKTHRSSLTSFTKEKKSKSLGLLKYIEYT